MMDELWTPIQWALRYEISTEGNVRMRFDHGRTRPVRIMRRADGQQYVTIWADGRLTEVYVEDLVLEHFGG